MSELECRGTAVINRKQRNLRFSCNFDIFPGRLDSFSERLHKEKVLLYRFNKTMDGLHVRFVVAVISDQYPSAFVRYSKGNWTGETTDIELTRSGSYVPSADGSCYYDAVVPLSALMPAEHDTIQFRVGCRDGRLVKFDNNGGVMYEVQRLPPADDDNSNNSARQQL